MSEVDQCALNNNKDVDTTNSTLKSSSLSRSTSFSSLQSDDDYQSTSDQLENMVQPAAAVVVVARDECIKTEPQRLANPCLLSVVGASQAPTKRCTRYTKVSRLSWHSHRRLPNAPPVRRTLWREFARSASSSSTRSTRTYSRPTATA